MSITKLLKSLGNLSESAYVGEPVSQLEHGLQAAGLAIKAGAGEHMILAALLHDVGHWCNPEASQMESLGTRDHEKLGAEYLDAIGLQPEISALVGSHVEAKRYLAATTPEYIAKLSSASRKTLDFQGGPIGVRRGDARAVAGVGPGSKHHVFQWAAVDFKGVFLLVGDTPGNSERRSIFQSEGPADVLGGQLGREGV